ncbi:TonB-dependent receptor [Pseudoflavitalea sp. G-6-1-2]|uniref:TonB-dependent receptor n=1 Tax=Pseudoflavitalea sp. G-6-1-2 TaxID=2728841 RepID=UPI00146CE177|nr:TonB-dependent receptor [Pseudoflavitalea sp. G-6-1-2]NML23868.1 TonB-dependent receptor [Pseudoflavitalea sp. G-6-1-2]
MTLKQTQEPVPFFSKLAGALIIVFMLLAPGLRAQGGKEAKLSISFTASTLDFALDQLKENCPVNIVYDASKLDLKKYSVAAKTFSNAPLKQVLEFLLQKTGLTFKELGSGIIVFKPEERTTPPAHEAGAQTNAILKGRVVDFETSQPLGGATIRVMEAAKTVTSNEDGYYEIGNIPSGKYTLIITYAGYQENKFPGVRLSGGLFTFDVKMQVGNALSTVVVSSLGRKVKSVTHSTDKQLVAEIRAATGVVSGVSNEFINKTADRNAADVVKRIAGVTVVDDRFIVVRGMNERYNLTYLNGNVAPSTELYGKAFAFDLLPSSVIDKILVYKSPVADLVADYGGAAVKVFTKNTAPVKHLDIGLQLGHRPGSTLSTINSYNGGKYDFLGFDDGTRKEPGFSQDQTLPGAGKDRLSQAEMLKSFSSTLHLGTKRSLPDMQVNINYYDTWKTGEKGRLFNITSVTYSHETKNPTISMQTGNTYAYQLDPVYGNYGGLNRFRVSRQSSENSKINVLENLTWKWNEYNRLMLRNFFVNDGRVLTSIVDASPNAVHRLDSSGQYKRTKDYMLSFQQRTLYSVNLGGAHQFRKNKSSEFEWNLGYTFNQQKVPDQRILHFQSYNFGPYYSVGSNTGLMENQFYGMISRLFTTNREQVYNASIDYTMHLTKQWMVKAGTYQMYKLREVNRRFFRINRGGLMPGDHGGANGAANEPAYNDGYGLSDRRKTWFTPNQLNNLWSEYYFPENNSGLKIYDETSPSDSYKASEQNNSAYLMGEWKTTNEQFTVNAGLRVEYDRQKAASGVQQDDRLKLSYANHPLTSWLPSLNISYRPFSTIVARAGYGRTVNRPEFREISSFNDFDFSNNERINGDPSVVTSTLDNYDFRAEWYPKSLQQNEMLTAGVFYKRIKDPIERFRREQTSPDLANFTNITYGNTFRAEVYGVEAEIRKNLGFISKRYLKNITLVLNGAWVESKTTQIIKNGFRRDTLPGRPLQGQSPYVLNGGLFYENIGWGTKVGVIYNVNGPRIYAKAPYNPKSTIQDPREQQLSRPDLVQLPMHLLDVAITQRLVKSLQAKFTVQNILDQSSQIIEDHNYDQRYDKEYPITNPTTKEVYYGGDNYYSKFKPGLYFLLQFTYAF